MKWEYKITTIAKDDMHILGQEGWELVAVSVVFNMEWLYFKRPLKEEVPEEVLRDVLK